MLCAFEDGCQKPRHKRYKLCAMHRKRKERTGDPAKIFCHKCKKPFKPDESNVCGECLYRRET